MSVVYILCKPKSLFIRFVLLEFVLFSLGQIVI